MAIFSNSRYQYSHIGYIQRKVRGSIDPIVFYDSDDLSNAKYFIHTYAMDETLHELSWRYFDRPDMWWAIVEYNPEITDFFKIEPGRAIRIPRV